MAETYSVEAVLKAVGSNEFINAFKKAKEQVEGFDEQTQKASKSTEFTMGKLVGAIGITTALSKGYNMIKDSVSRAFSRVDTMEQFERVMTTLTGSTDKANEVLAKVNETVKGTAYGLDVGAKAVQGFVTSNMDVDKATMTFESWGDAVAFYGDGTNATLGSVTDALAKATAKGKIQMDTMNSLAEAGIPAMQLYADATGRSVEEVADEMSKGKIRADEFHEVMNKAMIEGTDNFKSIKGAAKEAGASWTGSFDNMRAAVTRGVIAIVQNIDDMLKDNGLPQMRDMVAEFGKKFEEVLKKAADAIPIVIDKIKEFYNRLEPWLPLIKGVAGALAIFVSAFAGVNTAINIAKNTMKAFNAVMALNPWALLAAAIIAAVALVYIYWEPISGFFVKLWGKIKVIWSSTVDWFKNIWGGISDWFKNLWDGLVAFLKEWGLVILGLLTGPVGLAAALIYKYWEPIKEFFYSLWESVKEKTSEIWTSIVDLTLETWTNITNAISNILQPFISMFMNLWNGAKDGIIQMWEGLKLFFEGFWELLKNIFLGAILLIVNLVTGNFEELRSNAMAIWENLKEGFSKIWEGISLIFSGAIDAVKGYLSAGWENVKVVTSATFEFVKNLLSKIWVGIKSIFSATINFLVNYVKNSWTNIKNTTSSIFSGVRSLITSIWNGIKTFFTQTLSNIWNAIKQKFTDIVNSVREKTNEAKQKVEDGWNKAVEFLKNIDLMQIGKDVIQGFINGIKNMVGKVASAAKEAADAVTGKIKSILKIASPSKVLTKFGEWTGEGMEGGILAKVKDIAKAAKDMAVAAVPDMKDINIADRVDMLNGVVNTQMDVEHSNTTDNRMINLLQKIANSNQVIVLDTGELVGGTYREYDRVGGSRMELAERWGEE